jgi:hypothetical protein
MENRERALRLEVRVHAPKPSPFGWEIYDGDDAEEPIKCSQGTYRTEEAAEASPPDRRCNAVVIALRKKAAAV